MEPTGFAAFDRLPGVAHSVRAALSVALSEPLEQASVELLTRDVLPHLELVETGARLSIGSSGHGLVHATGSTDELDGSAREAAGQARIILALVPRLPRELTSWPGPGSYRDLFPPASDAEMVARVEELRGVVWRAASTRRLPSSGPARRTFAFFETASWLAVAGPRGFGGLGRH